MLEQALDERLPLDASPAGGCAVHAVQELGGRHRGERDVVVAVACQDVIDLERAALGCDQHAGVDHRAHGEGPTTA